jgi:hypothetical protein
MRTGDIQPIAQPTISAVLPENLATRYVVMTRPLPLMSETTKLKSKTGATPHETDILMLYYYLSYYLI